MLSVVLQDASPLYREGLCRLLEATSDFAAHPVERLDEVVSTCAATGSLFAIVELTDDETRSACIAALEQAGVRVVGTRRAARGDARLSTMIATVERSCGPDELAAALLAAPGARSAPSTRRRGSPGALTSRELQVLALIGTGCTSPEIGRRLGISAKTVEGRRQAIFAKLGVQSQAHAVSLALRSGLLAGAVGAGAR